jgi:choline kinase
MGGSTPKALLPVGDHEPLLHYTLAALKSVGVEDLLVVTGFKPKEVQGFIAEHWGDATYIFNARYASWGNFHTLRMGLDQSPGYDVLSVNSDIVIHPDALKRVVTTRGDLVLAVQQRYGLDQEDMRVRLQGDRVRAIGKDLLMRQSQGEFCGVSLLRPAAAGLYLDISSTWEWEARTHVYYEDVFSAMLDRVDTRAAPVHEGEYAEVDVPDDMRFAAAVVERHADVWASAPTPEPV